MVPEENGHRKIGPRKLVPGKMVPRKLVPGKLRKEKSRCGRRASWCVCVCGMLRCDQSMKTQYSTANPKLENKTKTRKQKIVG